jgi:hypothetical protein
MLRQLAKSEGSGSGVGLCCLHAVLLLFLLLSGMAVMVGMQGAKATMCWPSKKESNHFFVGLGGSSCADWQTVQQLFSGGCVCAHAGSV